jgi:integrase/recombinase XerC
MLRPLFATLLGMGTSDQLSFADLGTAEEAGPTGGSPRPDSPERKGPTSMRPADRAALAALDAALSEAREGADDRPPLVVLAACLGHLGSPPAPAAVSVASLRQARDDWLRRLETARKSESALVAYRVAIDGLLDWCEAQRRNVLDEQTIVDYLSAYEERTHPAPATYYRRFLLLRRFLRRSTKRDGVPDPFLDLEPPPKPRQERDWLTPGEFRKLLDAAAHPQRNLPGLAERDRLVLLALVTTGLRRSELCALEWRDLDLDCRKRSLLVRCGKGGKPRRQPVPAGLARELRRIREARLPEATDPVFCGLAGRRLQETILADIIRRAAARAGIDKHVTAHTLRHTAATWLRQEMGDTRLAAEYLGHADISTVARYAHVDRTELFEAAGRLERLAAPEVETRNIQPEPGPTGSGDSASSQASPADAPAKKPRHRRIRGRRRRHR